MPSRKAPGRRSPAASAGESDGGSLDISDPGSAATTGRSAGEDSSQADGARGTSSSDQLTQLSESGRDNHPAPQLPSPGHPLAPDAKRTSLPVGFSISFASPSVAREGGSETFSLSEPTAARMDSDAKHARSDVPRIHSGPNFLSVLTSGESAVGHGDDVCKVGSREGVCKVGSREGVCKVGSREGVCKVGSREGVCKVGSREGDASELQSLRASLRRAEREAAEARRHSEELASQVDTFQERFWERLSQTTLAAAEAQRRSEEEIASLHAQLEEEQREVGALRSRCSSLETQCLHQSQEIAEARELEASLRSDAEAQAGELRRNAALLRDVEDRRGEQAAAELRRLRASLAASEREAQEADAVRGGLELELLALRQRVNDGAASRGDGAARLRQAEAELSSARLRQAEAEADAAATRRRAASAGACRQELRLARQLLLALFVGMGSDDSSMCAATLARVRDVMTAATAAASGLPAGDGAVQGLVSGVLSAAHGLACGDAELRHGDAVKVVEGAETVRAACLARGIECDAAKAGYAGQKAAVVSAEGGDAELLFDDGALWWLPVSVLRVGQP